MENVVRFNPFSIGFPQKLKPVGRTHKLMERQQTDGQSESFRSSR